MSGMAFFHHLKRRLTVYRPFCPNPDLTQCVNRALAEIFIVVHNQHIPAWEKHVLQTRFCLFQIQRHVKFRAFVLLALHLNAAFHGLYNALRDGHSKSRSFNLANLRLISCKAVKDLLHKFRRHSDPGILYPEMAPYILISLRRVLLGEIDVDPAVLRRKLDRV